MRRTPISTYVAVLFGFFSLTHVGIAAAYLGPGAGLGMLGSLIAVVFVALVIVLGLVIYPIKLLRSKRKARALQQENTAK